MACSYYPNEDCGWVCRRDEFKVKVTSSVVTDSVRSRTQVLRLRGNTRCDVLQQLHYLFAGDLNTGFEMLEE